MIKPSSLTYSQQAALLGTARCALGVGLLTRPARFARLAGVDRVTAERTAWITRLAAARDIAVGAGLLTSLLRRDGPPTRGWLRAGALIDTADAAVLLNAGARRDIAWAPAVAAALTAATSAVQAGLLTTRPPAGADPADRRATALGERIRRVKRPTPAEEGSGLA
ncbi:DUF4267 domain-containing protein [Frankia sp. CiP1_Cm_nod1]